MGWCILREHVNLLDDGQLLDRETYLLLLVEEDGCIIVSINTLKLMNANRHSFSIQDFAHLEVQEKIERNTCFVFITGIAQSL